MTATTRNALLLAALTACTSRLDLPSAPAAAPPAPRVDAIDPAHAFAGARVRISGANLAGSEVEVTFGASRDAEVLDVEAGGRWIDAVVPEDATAGPVKVRTPAGSASSGGFLYDGLGRLRHGRITSRADLRPELATALPSPWEYLVLDRTLYRSASFTRWTGPVESHGFASLPQIRAIATGAGTAYFALYSDPADTGGCVHRLWRFDTGTGTGETVRLESDAGEGSCWPTRGLAVDPTDALALVVGNESMFFVDFAQAPPHVERLVGLGVVALAAWLGDGEFVVTDGADLRLVARGDAGWEVGEPFETFAMDDDAWGLPVEQLATAPETHAIAAGTALGDVAVLERAADGLRRRTVLAPLTRAGRYSLALSRGGDHLLVSATGTGRAFLVDVTADPAVPMQGIDLPEPDDAFAGSDGLFHVACRGAIATVSQRTGGLISMLPVSARFETPLLRRPLPARTAGDARGQALEVVSNEFRRVVRLNPADLRRVDAPHGLAPLPGEGTLCGMTAMPDGDTLFVCRDGTGIVRQGPDDDAGPAAPASPIPLVSIHPPLLLSPDGLALAARTVHMADTQNAVVLVDLRSEPPVAHSLPLEWEPVAVRFMGSRLVVVGPTAVRVLDFEAARSGTARALRDDIALPGRTYFEDLSPVAGISGTTIFLVLTADERPRRIVAVDVETGRVTEAEGDPAPSAAPVRLSPGGTSLWWLTGEDASRRLVREAFDAPQARLAGERGTVALPGGARDVVAYPNGEHLVVVDTSFDELILLE